LEKKTMPEIKRGDTKQQQNQRTLEQFLTLYPTVSRRSIDRIVEHFNALPVDERVFSIRTLERVVSRIALDDAILLVENLGADSYQATLAANPSLRDALDGTYIGTIDPSSVRVVLPKPVTQYAGDAVEAAINRQREREANARRARAGAVESQRGHSGVNATLSRRQDFEK
jgi:hypothetical protein